MILHNVVEQRGTLRIMSLAPNKAEAWIQLMGGGRLFQRATHSLLLILSTVGPIGVFIVTSRLDRV